ncbi:hypothetical protein COV18_06100 [Candidatus Woesearchaeota archaeon CG10_big_fil_rev_8_21_14_0_10_37_12]|nr:MAG: hypothetical protein COV18_06100 [Candidatus Woesearchaeota archaeon CG10_big_fil_rev_8_21_14_0_10_37_12]
MAAPTCAPEACGPKCIILVLIAILLTAGGLWMLVAGWQMQTAGFVWSQVTLWYAGGFLLWCIAKCIKMKACGKCR